MNSDRIREFKKKSAMGKIKKIEILSGCISCGACEVVCPSVFVVKQEAKIKEDAQIQENEDCIREAADMCPVQVIRIIEE